MMMFCAVILSVTFMLFAFLAIFSSTARWIIDMSMKKVADVISEGEESRMKRIRSHRQEAHPES